MNASIIIPCYNAEQSISETLCALEKNSMKAFEIIVVDDGSTDSTANIVKSIAKKNKNIMYLWQKNSGPAKARNFGAKIAKGEVVLFIDSDCIPKKNWLKEMIKPFNNKKVGGVQGAYTTNQKELIAKFVQIEIEERYEKMKKAEMNGTLDWIGSYSAAYRRGIYKELGGFDESFPIASGEDPELSYRLKESGYMIKFNPNAIVYHTHPNNLFKYLKTKFMRAYYRPKMYSKHKKKIIKDSYTPQELKLQIVLIYALIPSIITSLFSPLGLIVTAIILGLHIVLGVKFFLFAWKKNKAIAIASIALLFLRNIYFSTGLIMGVIKK